MNKILLMIITLIISIQVQANELTWSQSTVDLEIDSPKRKAWVFSKNKKTNEALKKIADFKVISSELWKTFNTPVVVAIHRIDDNSVLKIIDQGIGQPTLVNVTKNGSEKTIFSSYHFRKNNQYQIDSTKLSANGKWVTIGLAHKGTTDDFYYLIINTDTGAIAFEKQFNGFSAKPNFISADVFAYIDKVNDKEEMIYFNLNTLTKEVQPEVNRINTGFKLVRVITNSQDYYVDFKGRKFAVINNLWPSDAVAYKDGVLWTTRRSWNEKDLNKYTHSLIATTLSDKAETTTSSTVLTLSKEIIDETLLEAGYLILQTHWGTDRKLRIFKTSGEAVYTGIIPPEVNLTVEGWQKVAEKLKISLHGPGGNVEQVLDISNPKTKITVPKILFELAGMTLDIQTLMVPSFDGTLIPIQIIKSLSSKIAQTRPAFIRVYGGFENAGYLFDFNESGLRKFIPFLSRGGMIVNTGVRGGDEFGPVWNTSVKKANKNKTFEDAASIAKYLIDNKLSIKEQITLTGSSNGGFVSAATGLLYDKYFGLIIPHAGVHDMLGKTRIDSRFNGWTHEYLDETDANEQPAIAAQSPLEIAGNGKFNIPFLIMTGRNDSRVNAAHSYKLQSVLEKTNQAPTHLYAINNAGHFEQNATNSDVIAWRVWSVIWSFTLNR